jgi:hypothetical protein
VKMLPRIFLTRRKEAAGSQEYPHYFEHILMELVPLVRVLLKLVFIETKPYSELHLVIQMHES